MMIQEPFLAGARERSRAALALRSMRTSRAAIAACIFLGGTAAQGQETAESAAQQSETREEVAIEEIVVTATKRGAQRVQEVPAAIQAFGGDRIEQLLATDFTDLAGFVSGLQFQDLGPGDKEFIIRGVNSSATATVGVYFGEAVITARNKQDGGGRQALFELHDLDRIEVLKGPQGTLFGASSMSGTIRFIPNAPELGALDFYTEGEISDTHKGGTNYRWNGMVNLPIVEDKLALRAVGWISDESGFVDNVRLGRENINSNNVEGGRFMLRWQPDPALDVTLSANIQNRSVGGSSRFSSRYQESYLANLQTFGLAAPELGDLTNQDFTINDWDEKMELYGATVDYSADWGTLLGTVNYLERDIDFRFDSTPILLFFGVPAAALTFEPQSRELLTAELRYASNFDGPVNFVAGGFLSREDKDFEVQVLATNELGRPIGPFDTTKDFFIDGPPNAAIFGRVKTDDLDQEALFGEITIDLTERLQLVGGIRYFQFDILSSGRETKPFVGFAEGSREVDISEDDETVTFKANLSYQVTPDQLLYFTAAEGFRVGGTNDAAINPMDVPVPEGFDPDNLWNYEIGWKTAWLDDRLIVNGAAYLVFWDNIQVEGLDPSGAFPLVTNAGKARVDGIELEVIARPAPGLELTLGGSLQDARLTEDSPFSDPASPNFDPNSGREGDAFPNVPDFQGFASAQYRWPIPTTSRMFANLAGVLRADLTYRGETDTTFREDSPFNVDLDNYTLVNLRAGITSDHWRLSLFGKNVFDKRAQVDAINSAQDPLGFITVRPATYGLNVAFSY